MIIQIETDENNYYKSVDKFEKTLIEWLLWKNKGNITKAALNAGLDQSGLYYKIRKLEIDVKQFKK